MSSNKLFTLIHKDTVLQATNKKILPKEIVGTLLSAEGVLEAVQKDALQYKQEVAAECEKIKEQAVREGFAAGYEEWVVHIKKLEEEISKVRDELQKLIIPIALKVAKKIVSAELSINPESIVDIVTNTLKAVAQHKKIILYLNKQDLETIDANKNKIREIFESLESLSLRDRDDIEPGGCIVETEGGIINARIEDRWRSIESAMEALAESLKKGVKEDDK